MRNLKTYEEFINESTVSWKKLMDSVKKGKGPWSLVVVDPNQNYPKGKVIDQELVDNRDAIPAHFENLKARHDKRAIIHIEDSEGKRLWSSMNEFEGSYGGSTQLATDLFLTMQTAGNGVAF